MSDHHPDVTDALDATAAAAALVAEDDARSTGAASTPTGSAFEPDPRSAPQPGLFRRILPRITALRHELGKFGVVGAVAYACDFTTFNVSLTVLELNATKATVVATVVGATVSFIGNRFWTWRHRERSGLHREYALYSVVSLVGLLISLACVAFSEHVLGSVWPIFTSLIALNVAKNIVGMGFGTLFRFWAYRTFVFREAPRTVE
ncbi:MAG TPA: GtrA family protein [Micromonosporaceae bacterium]|nr:GtrA family protein [Micromonosporaceae bacterium]